MNFNRIIRFLGKHRQALLVWVMVPLAVVDAQTIVGCGCAGHFESICQCNSCDSTRVKLASDRASFASRDSHKLHSRSCCSDAKTAVNHVQHRRANLQTPRANCLLPHPCKQLSVRIGDTVIIVPAHAPNQNSIAAMVPAILDLPTDYAATDSRHVFSFDSGPPPCDVVVTLHRLII